MTYRYYSLAQALETPIEVTELSAYIYHEDEFLQIAQLVNLEFLEINNYASSALDYTVLHQLPKLKALLLHYNMHQIPLEIFRLHNLENLTIFCGLFPQLPPELGELQHLKTLSLTHGKLKSLPTEIGALKRLTHLYLNNNKIDKLPEEILQLSALNTLNVEHNKIKQLPRNIHQLANLQHLTLNHNPIQQLPEDLALLPLKSLLIGFTPIHQTLGQKQRNLAGLFRQFAKHNLPENLCKLYFQLFLNNIPKALTLGTESEVLSGLNAANASIRLNVLNYYYQKVENPLLKTENPNCTLFLAGGFKQWGRADLIAKLTEQGLKIVNQIDEKVDYVVLGDKPKEQLHKAQVLQIPLLTQGHLKDLLNQKTAWYLTQNDENTTDMIQNLQALLKSDDTANQRLGLEMMLGGGIHPTVLYDVVMLYIWNQYTETKNLAEKVLEKFLPADLFGHLRGRVKLYYDDPSEDNISNYLQSLQHTKLNPNLLGIAFYEWTQCGRRFCVQFPDSFLVVAKKELRNNVLHLTQTQLKKLAETIGELSQLKMLYLQNNHLKDLPTAFVKLQRLNTLNLSKNNFSNFPPEVFALPCLQHLSLSHNKVTDIPAAITRLPRLTTLNLQHNAISILPEVLAQLTSLKVLELKNNPLKMKKAEIQAWLPDCKIVM